MRAFLVPPTSPTSHASLNYRVIRIKEFAKVSSFHHFHQSMMPPNFSFSDKIPHLTSKSCLATCCPQVASRFVYSKTHIGTCSTDSTLDYFICHKQCASLAKSYSAMFIPQVTSQLRDGAYDYESSASFFSVIVDLI